MIQYLQEVREMKEEKIYDVVLNKVVPITKATNKGLHTFLANTPDDGYIEHNLILACISELERRKKS
jgi:hypothetical protein